MPDSSSRILANLVRHMANAEHDPLTPLIDTYLIDRKKPGVNRLQEWTIQIPERPRPGGRLSPSSIAGCQRQAILKYIGYQPPRKIIDPDRELIFEDGNWRHHKWDAMFYDMQAVLGPKLFRVVEIERTVTIPKLYIAGSLDATIKIKVGNSWLRYVVDFKGANSYAFYRVFRDHQPIEEHVKQLFTYMVARGIRRGILLYDCKNDQQFKVFVFELDEEVWQQVERWCQRVILSIKRRELPGRHPSCHDGSFLYDKCGFAPFCFGKHRDDRRRLRQIAFRDFEGLDEAWERGLREA